MAKILPPNYPELDNFHRPTSQAWICPTCKVKLFEKETIESHIERGCQKPKEENLIDKVRRMIEQRNKTITSTAIEFLLKIVKEKRLDYKIVTRKVLSIFDFKNSITLSDLIQSTKWRG